MARMKILITGAGGMLGTDLAKELGPENDLVLIDKRPAPHIGTPIEFCDLTQERKAHELLVSSGPDLVIHAAALTDVDYCESHHDEALAHNVEATKVISKAANEIGAPLLFFSSDYVFDGEKIGEYLESDGKCPVSFYGETKRMAEDFILSEAKRAVIFRISWLYGVHGRSFPRAILRQASEVTKMSVVSDQIGRPTYTRDIAAAIRDLLCRHDRPLFRESREIYHLTNSGSVSWADFARFLLKEKNIEGVTVENITSDQLRRPARRPKNSLLSLARTNKELGISLRPWQDAAREFLAELEAFRIAAEAKESESKATDDQSN